MVLEGLEPLVLIHHEAAVDHVALVVVQPYKAVHMAVVGDREGNTILVVTSIL
jgi:hypothetical protein